VLRPNWGVANRVLLKLQKRKRKKGGRKQFQGHDPLVEATGDWHTRELQWFHIILKGKQHTVVATIGKVVQYYERGVVHQALGEVQTSC
jgi:hypothetical protein